MNIYKYLEKEPGGNTTEQSWYIVLHNADIFPPIMGK